MSQALDPSLRYSIRTTISALEDISDVRVTATHARSYSLARREQRFAALLSVAGFILENESPDPVNPLKDDQRKSPPTVGMMINMEKLFEEYAFEMLKSGGGSFRERFKIHDHVVIAQNHDREANCVIRNRKPAESLFGLKPDLLFRDSKGRVALVADTKWKRISPPAESNPVSGEEVVKVGTFGIRQADVYQLFAYSEYFAEPKTPSDVVLIYPQDPRLEPAIGDDAELAKNDIKLTALPSVGKIDWEFCPRSRSEGKPAKLIIKLFPLPLLGAKHLPKSANPGLQ
jgi:5-methylcytosine-specific restriction endonuclease McrBC regulatory subunit McrC